MILVYRYSFLSAVISSFKNSSPTYSLSQYLTNTHWQDKTDKVFKAIESLPEDYNGDNYDLFFDDEYNFVRAEKDYNKTLEAI